MPKENVHAFIEEGLAHMQGLALRLYKGEGQNLSERITIT
jgi:hypothetical protein